MLRTKTVGLLLNKEIRENKKSIIWLAVALLVVLFILAFGGSAFRRAEMPNLVEFLFFVTGLFLSANAFQELKQPKTAQQYLLIPATAAEKVVAKTIIYTFGTAIMYVVCLKLALLAAFAALNSGGAGITFEQFVQTVYNTVLQLCSNWYSFILLMAIAAFASVYFRRLALLKLVVSSGVIGAVISVLLLVEVVILYHGWGNVNINLSAQGDVLLKAVMGSFDFMGTIVSVMIKALVIPFFWVMTWLRLRETEA